MGRGELSVLGLSKEFKNSIIVSDDQQFIKRLETEKIDFLVPADTIVLLQKLGNIEKKEAGHYLEKIKVFIREKDYEKIKKQLEEK